MNFKPNFKTVELCLTYRCNLKCNNCSNLCTQAPINSDGDLRLCEIDFFLNDIEGKGVEQITLHGGEPVLNPNIDIIVEKLCAFREKTGVRLWLLSNNSNDRIRQKITSIHVKYNIPLGIATKDGNNLPYIPVNESPSDLELDYTLGCFQTSDCGICFNYLGYFPCSPMAAAARVFGFAGVQLIDHLDIETCNEFFNLHCKHCGFAIPDRRRVTEQTSTETWIKNFNEYRQTIKETDR